MAVKWQEQLLKQAKIAYETGQELTFAVVKRYGQRKYRISLKRTVEHGEDEVAEEN